jgi:hypothetical protein
LRGGPVVAFRPAVPVVLDSRSLSSVGLQRTLGMPESGPKILPIRLDFASNPAYSLDYSNQTNLGFLDLVQTVFADNFGNGQVLKITCPASQQVIQVPAGIQGYFPILVPNPIRLLFESTGGTVQSVILINFPVFA